MAVSQAVGSNVYDVEAGSIATLSSALTLGHTPATLCTSFSLRFYAYTYIKISFIKFLTWLHKLASSLKFFSVPTKP